MAFTLPELPFAMDALSPHISKETLEYHYGKHHKGYVDKLNAAIEGTRYASMSLEEIVREAKEAKVFNSAAQTWNHTFYWNSLSPNGGGEPQGSLAQALTENFGDLASFKSAFTQTAATLFGSGWAWLVKNSDGKLSIAGTKDAGNPMTESQTPLLTCDVWEHAYYIDYRNARPKYIEAFWNLVNWEFVEKNLGG